MQLRVPPRMHRLIITSAHLSDANCYRRIGIYKREGWLFYRVYTGDGE